jgi:hypothetical protein
MATGCGPAELLAGGRDYFDALVEELSEERENGWVVEEQLASLIEINWAMLRALIALGGGRPPRQFNVPRPGNGARPPKTSILDLQKRLGG